MNDEAAPVSLVCPRCKTAEPTALDIEEPQEAVIVEQPCPKCLDEDDSLIIEPRYRDKHGIYITNSKEC